MAARSDDARDLLRIGFTESQGDRMKAARVDGEIKLSSIEGYSVHARHMEIDLQTFTPGARGGDFDCSWRDVEARNVKAVSDEPQYGRSSSAPDIEYAGAPWKALLPNRPNYPRRGLVGEPRHPTVIAAEVPVVPSHEFGLGACSAWRASRSGHVDPRPCSRR